MTDKNMITIEVSGSQGSGKTTIIGMIKKMLEGDVPKHLTGKRVRFVDDGVCTGCGHPITVSRIPYSRTITKGCNCGVAA
jgi:adenylylsulfate kinase-like enzyme